MFEHQDTLTSLDENTSLSEKLTYIHAALNERFPFIARISVAIYDAKTDLLKTFIQSSSGADPLKQYQARLSEAGSLQEILRLRRPRVVNDLDLFASGTAEHTRRIAEEGYRASYTMPMYNHGQFFGFLFFNSSAVDAFSEEVLRQIDPFGHLISLTVIHELASLRTLLATVQTAHDIANVRDSETGAHLERMSRYARLIARKLADQYELSDEYIENIFVFSPLHDIGKIGIPDEVLLKPGALESEEWEIMKTHPVKGREIIDRMLGNFNLNGVRSIDILRNIAELHHETFDGKGYPYGRSAAAIPLESRIVAVADIFDALVSRRPYKQAWSNDEAFAMLQKLAGDKLDQDCVRVLLESREELETIQRQFNEDSLG